MTERCDFPSMKSSLTGNASNLSAKWPQRPPGLQIWVAWPKGLCTRNFVDETRYDHPIIDSVVSREGQTNIIENSRAEYCRNSSDTAESFPDFQEKQNM